MDVEGVAREALVRGVVEAASRSGFARGEARAVAVDAHDGVAAVLVVGRRDDDGWIADVVRFVRGDGAWTDVGSGGATWGDLPLDVDPGAEPGLGPVSTGWSAVDDDHGIATAGGFVVGRVAAVELACGDAVRRVAIPACASAFVVTVRAPDTDDLDTIDVRAIAAGGDVVDSTARWEADRQAALPGVTVAEALALPDGTPTTVHGVLLALPGQPAVLCDDIDHGPPLRCRGAPLRIETTAPLPPTEVTDGGAALVMMVISGVVRAGVLTSAT